MTAHTTAALALGAVLLADGVLAAGSTVAMTGLAPARDDHIGRGAWGTRSESLGRNGMAATSHPLATLAAIDILRNGGSAVDAAIAANACLGLMEPTGCGIGGDLFAIVWDPATAKLHGYNGSGRSPKDVSVEKLRARGVDIIPMFGPLTVTVPGCVDGWTALHGRFGKLPLEKVLAPAIAHAEQGFPVTEVIADGWARSVRRFAKEPNFAETFTLGGAAPAAGDIWRNPALAQTYRAIASSGRDGFYRGPIAQAVAGEIQRQGGYMTADDLAAHAGEWVDPVSTTYRGVELWELPPNGQGIAALQILNILEGYDAAGWRFGSADHLHAFIEAKKIAFEDRARHYADPAFGKVPVATLISKPYAAKRRAVLNMQQAAKAVEPGYIPTGADTVYLAVADSSGMMVSLIQSNYRGMGSGVVPPGVGFMLQNRGEQFAMAEGHPNRLEGGKRPFHTIIPAFITRDGKPWIAFGLMGGAMQPQGHAQIVMNLVDFKMGLQEAGDAPRIHHDGSTEPVGPVKPMSDGGVVNLERGFSAEALATLASRGHTIKPADTAVFGGYQAIMWDEARKVWVGASERRKDGMALGY
jgi:gamma-glutamyltranspeptidase / glutathione hydrolase